MDSRLGFGNKGQHNVPMSPDRQAVRMSKRHSLLSSFLLPARISPSWRRFTAPFRPAKAAAGLAALLGFAATLQADPLVTCENFNELGNGYQSAVNNNALRGLPTGITANFNWHCQLMWSPGVNPPNSTATNNVEVGWTPASPAVTFSKPVVLWSVQAFKKWNNTLTLTGKRSGVQVWSYTNSDPANSAWTMVTYGAGKIIDELDVNSDSWGVKLTDFRLSDATGFSPFTNVSPYCVDGANALASDNNPGTEAQPWKTIQWAAAYLQAGETVQIKAATYTGDVYPASSGNANGWITYSAYPGQEQQAVIDHAGFYIQQKSYLKVSGLKVQHSSGWGIGIQGPGANNISISGNYVYDIVNSGIAAWGVPYGQDPGQYHFQAITNLLVINNTVEQCCNGGYDEQISIANGVYGFEVCSNVVKNGINNYNGGEGIDCKEADGNGKIWGNRLFNLQRNAIYLDAGRGWNFAVPGTHTNIEIYANVVYGTAAHGICVTSEGNGNLNGIKVYNNVCYSNGCDGILLYDYGASSSANYASNVIIINNTTCNNNASTTTPYYGGIATDHKYAQNVVVRNNIAYETLQGAFAIKQPFNPATVMDHNIATTTSNPGFVGAARADFHLQSNSPAINRGSPAGAPMDDFDGSARPSGPAFDVGAFEYYSPSPVRLQIQLPRGQPSPVLLLQGGPESHYRVEWRPALGSGSWSLLQDIPSLPRTPYTVSDPTPVAAGSQRFYQVVLLP